MYELLKYVESEMESSSSDWYEEFLSFVTSSIFSAFDGLVASLTFIGGRLDV